ncbi:MAG: ribose 5-phosphate isomerase B [Firmicutes bacterium HGW-Firmicutes-16]|nr:MAG: ribose 5-phosphate isomerase B [Firmicutes bacterium HGW-Firmicutes-16]
MIALGSDHGGFELKNEIMKYLDEKGIAYKDFGTYSKDSCDYPVYAELVGKAVASGENESGILVCGTGIGVSISANKVKGVRAALCHDCYSAEYTRRHNNANILALGGRVIGVGHALKIVDIFLNTEFEGGRHARRVDIISKIEENN